MAYPMIEANKNSLHSGGINGGIAIDINENEIEDNKSPKMLNLIYDGRALKKREGQKYFSEAFSDNKIIACYEKSFYGYIIYHAGASICALNMETKERMELKGKLPDKKGVFFSYNGHVYYLGAGDYYKISYNKESEALTLSVAEGTIPTVLINCESNGIGDENQPYNYLTGGFKLTYHTSSALNSIVVPGAPLDNTKPLKILYNNSQISASDYSVNYNTGVVTFSRSFANGHNNLEVTAYAGGADVAEDRKKIIGCNLAAIYGGASAGLFDGTRLFVSGNPDYANTFYKSALRDPEYFPVEQFEILGDILDPITGFGKQYTSLIIFKEQSIYLSNYDYSTGEVIFTISQIHPSIGCDAPGSIQIVSNQLVWLNTVYGVMTLSSTNIKDEKNVLVISQNINGSVSGKGLLGQDNLKNAVSFLYKERYYLCVGQYTYVLAFRQDFYWGMNPRMFAWYLFDGIKANCALTEDGKIYLGAQNEVFTIFDNVLYDFETSVPIRAYFQTKAFDFGRPDLFKRIYDVVAMLRADNNSYVRMSFIDEDNEVSKGYSYYINRFSFINLSFSKFTFFDNQYAILLRRKVQRRRVIYFSLYFENDMPNSDMAISEIIINYNIERGARYNGY